MSSIRLLLVLSVNALLVGGAACAARTAAPAGEPRPEVRTAAVAEAVTSSVTVTLPQPDAELTVDNRAIEGQGDTRTFETPAHARGTRQEMTLTATWRPNSYTTMTRTKTVPYRAGDPVVVDMAAEDPSDRVRVIYVPTPQDVAEEMVKLAGIRPTDVVFEPGCGDARITIAAIRAGARRGVCVDIDPERVEESRAKVREAGLGDRIDVRLGDALELRDWSQATVVFLYMGDHFNLLIRPVLWRELPVGARVVSHRFTMGDDWMPDKTVGVVAENGGEYTLHLWTITPQVKQRVSGAR